METRSKVVMASVYIGFFILSALVAFLLFTYLPGSEASAEGDMGGLNFKTGGAFAGFIISFWLLHLAVRSWYKHNPKLTGNVLDEDGAGLEGAMVSVSDVPGEEFTNRTGYFSKEVFGSKPEWVVRASKKDYLAATVTVKANAMQGVTLKLKKKPS